MPVTDEAPPMFGFFIGSSRERTLSGKRFVSATLAAPGGTAYVTNTESRRFRQSAIGESYRGTTFRTFCVDAVTEFCETCTSQSRSRPDDVSFHVQAWTRRTTKQLFQQLTLACRVAMIGTMRATFDNRQSNTILNKVVKRVRFFFRN